MPALSAALVNSIECAVSAVDVPAISGTDTLERTARHTSFFSLSVSAVASPVVPVTTSASLPWLTSQSASVAAPSRSTDPSARSDLIRSTLVWSGHAFVWLLFWAALFSLVDSWWYQRWWTLSAWNHLKFNVLDNKIIYSF
jgi:hypothetical protein